MASKIIHFPAPERPARSTQPSPEARAKALPDWLKALDVEWIFKEEERRRTSPKNR
ncbi:MAG: hypothetical protein ACX94D_09875 [Henriciella sp.]|jgi:hypothetical protein